jgi:hypothetical protein
MFIFFSFSGYFYTIVTGDPDMPNANSATIQFVSDDQATKSGVVTQIQCARLHLNNTPRLVCDLPAVHKASGWIGSVSIT